MTCDTKLRERQTLSERKAEVIKVIDLVAREIVNGRVRPKVGPQGAIAFDGLTAEQRNGVTDACIYRKIMATGSVMAKQQIARAEQLAGRSVNRQALAAGHHGHTDSAGNTTWHGGHK